MSNEKQGPNLMQAHDQWVSRPADERFRTMADLHAHCVGVKERAVQSRLNYGDLSVVPTKFVDAKYPDGLTLQGKSGLPAYMTHWSFSQLCARVGAPASYIRELPTALAAENVNHGLRNISDSKEAVGLFDNSGALTLRAFTSDRYSRVWNADITAKLMEFTGSHLDWSNPLCYAVTDAEKAIADENGMVPGGLYASDEDMFALLTTNRIPLNIGPKGMVKFALLSNSEVGKQCLQILFGVCDGTCGNLIIWNTRDVVEMSLRHVGSKIHEAVGQFELEMRKYAEESEVPIAEAVTKAKRYELGTDKESILDNTLAIIKRFALGAELGKTKITEALATAEKRTDRYGNPNTLWALISGLTENSQELSNMDQRLAVDKAAGKLMEVVF